VQDLALPVDGATLAASYSPAGEIALVALHGAASGTRDHRLYRHLQASLPAAGIGVLTFDRRGDGESTGEPSRGDFHRQALDALAVIRALSELGVRRVGLWGFSQGGWVAPLAASLSPDVAFLVLVASTGVTPAVQMMYATEQQLRRAGFGDAVVDRALDLRQRFEAWVHDPDATAGRALAADLTDAEREDWWPLSFLRKRLPTPEERDEWRAEMDFDPVPIFSRVAVPTLLFYGTDDAWTPVQRSVDVWRRTRGDRVDIVLIDGASHELEMPDGRLAPAYEKGLIDWLADRAVEGATSVWRA
jgi:pimeloyl-ACP methyl ester carboxylesterase